MGGGKSGVAKGKGGGGGAVLLNGVTYQGRTTHNYVNDGRFISQNGKPVKAAARNYNELKGILQEEGYRIAADAPYRSSTSNDMLVDLVGHGKVYTGTFNRYFDGGVEVTSIKERRGNFSHMRGV